MRPTEVGAMPVRGLVRHGKDGVIGWFQRSILNLPGAHLQGIYRGFTRDSLGIMAKYGIYTSSHSLCGIILSLSSPSRYSINTAPIYHELRYNPH